MDKEPIINCHTHIFTGDHVPGFLARTFVPPPFHFLLPLWPVVAFFRWWYNGPATLRHKPLYKRLEKGYTALLAFFERLYPLNIVAGYYLFFFAFFLLYGLVKPVFPPEESWLSEKINWLYVVSDPVFPDIRSTALSVAIILVVLFFFETIRNLIIGVARLLWKVLGKLPGPQTREMFERYLNIGRYAFHKEQKTIFSKLKAQYPEGTRFVVLPMDMDYMGAGPSPVRYRQQMKDLADVKAMPSNKGLIYPFVFADPRRMVPLKEEKSSRGADQEYFNWGIQDGKIFLKDCFMKEYLEGHRFSGIKIYPALGYYPFDDQLLPLFKYCADHGVPVLTHCIRGVIFYRGRKKSGWNEHPVFEQAMRSKEEERTRDGYVDDEALEQDRNDADYVPLVLSQQRNMDFSYNFTHPMNYLVLLEEKLLRQRIGALKERDPQSGIPDLFGYQGPDQPLAHNLSNLKICLGHFGGEDEWKRFLEKDRYNFSSQLTRYPDRGIDFFRTQKGKPSRGKPEQLWRYTDWYSIICSMMLQYPNVYADISYILHGDRDILPLLKQTLQHPVLKLRVLYGTDFFVVRNHKSDKHMLADMRGGLTEEEFDQIARANPVKYLESTVPVI